MPDAALIIASPWPRSGTANLIAAQSLVLSSRGYRTAMLLSPHRPEHRQKLHAFWTATLDAMQFRGLDLICHARTNRRMKRWISQSFLQWHSHGQDSQLAIMARYAAAAELPRELFSFLDSNSVHCIIVNHCFQMPVARKIQRYLKRNHAQHPILILETHDVQANLYAAGKIDNVFRRQPDDLATLKRDELGLAEATDIMTHVTNEDMQYFRASLKARHHLVLATIDPANEQELLRIGEPSRTTEPRPIDFLFVGNNNPGNAISVEWFLSEVVPFLQNRFSIAIVGSVAAHIKSTNPELFFRYESYFVGQIADIAAYYRNAAVVVIPTRFGTGISIKTIEAMAAGKPIVATAAAFRGLPPGSDYSALCLSDNPAEFANAMVEARERRRELGDHARRLYLDLFSNSKYRERWDTVLNELH